MISISEIQQIFKGKISLNEKLAPYTTYRIGGFADYYAEPIDEQDLLNIVVYIKDKGLPYYIMGNGSNILISDDGIRGVVINLEKGFSYLRLDEGFIIAGAGAKMAKFVDFCIQNNYAGVEMLAGIPATIGGALIMNAGAYGGETSIYVNEVRAIRNKRISDLPKEDCGFTYRSSDLKDTVIIHGKFKLPLGDKAELSTKRKELLLKRNEAQPVEIPNAGCVFKNPEGNFASKLIQDSGLKGASYGGAMVSDKHSNFIVNYDNASANDVIELIKIVRKTVKEKTGYDLELEVKLVGFEEVAI